LCKAQQVVKTFSVFVFVLVFLQTLFFYNIQFNRIEAHDLQFCSTLFTRHDFALVRVQIYMDISIAFRASSGRHSLILPALSEGRDSPCRESTHHLVSNQINLPASAGICNSLFPRLLGHATLHFYAEIFCIVEGPISCGFARSTGAPDTTITQPKLKLKSLEASRIAVIVFENSTGTKPKVGLP
jgi:hypothetical protein